MNKFKYMGDDKTKIFYFTFPFFTKQDIVVKINNKPISGFRLHCTTNGMNADIPFSGGKITFAT
ncbi:MAG: hypothetical protein II238_01825, partial [Alphaproteobacteria bacterium]|nr:hypothetical protein [Alphaproteobacteria bacterium]